MRAGVIAAAVGLCVACERPIGQGPTGRLAGVRVVDLIPVSLSGETWQDAEPFLALYASNPKLMAASAFSPATMTLQAFRADIDQPFVRTTQVGSADRVYVGLNDFDAPDGRTATVDVSLDGGATYASRRIETRGTAGQNGPSIRPAVAPDHTVYVAYFGWRSNAGADVTSDVVVVRDDSGATGATPFRDLVDPSDSLPGRLVATHVTIPWSNAPTLGQERSGSTLAIAVDPLHSDNVYLAWADRVGTGDIYTVHVRRSTDRGATWSGDLRTLTNATDASLAVASDGTTGLL